MAVQLTKKDRALIEGDTSLPSTKALEVKNLTISFRTDNGKVQAVRGVSFDLYKGETLCIVGESGSGKSVTSKAIMGILSPNAIIEGGTILYNGIDLTKASEAEFQRIRGKKIGMIFQDPLSSLNPIVKIGKQITETMLINADMLKRYYEDLIAPEHTAYMNAASMRDVKIADAENRATLSLPGYQDRIEKIESEIASIQGQISTLKKKKGDVSSLKAELQKKKEEINTVKKENAEHLKKAKADSKVAILKAKKEYKEVAPGLYKALQEAKKKAKVATEKHHEELKAELQKGLDGIAAKRALLSIKPEDQARADELTSQIKKTEWLFRFQIALCYFLPKKHLALEQQKEAALKPLIEERNQILAESIALDKEEEEIRKTYQSQVRITKKMAKEKALSVMREVGIPQPEKRFKQYPFQFSGGMRQRIVIAIALISEPDVLICDEPTTALDVTIQAQILELINKLKAAHNMSVIFITHDLGVVANMADRVAVMYAGKICEYGTDKEIFFDPRHPYTWALLASIPDIDSKEKLEAIPGTPPDMIYPPKGDAFALRNRYAIGADFKYEPPLFQITPTHYCASWLEYEDAPDVVPPRIVTQRISNALKEEEAKRAHEKE